ncbi:MAG: DUF438 domain-containing protein [Bacilli bacterium]|nr:DUF438 domain-containing protein [Bacilli bacterium]
MKSNSFADSIARIAALDKFMEEYVESTARVKLYRRNQELLESVKPLDLFEVKYYRDDTKLDVETIKRDAGKFINLFRHGLEKFIPDKEEPELINRLKLENDAIRDYLDKIKPFLTADKLPKSRAKVGKLLEAMHVLKHKFVKLQNVLFPVVESFVKSRMPLVVLWSIHDDIENSRRKLMDKLNNPEADMTEINRLLGAFYYQITGLMEKEELIIFPVAIEVIDVKYWPQMLAEANKIGYAFLSFPSTPEPLSETHMVATNQLVMSTGTLSLEQLELVLSHLPHALTYVDEFDKVAYYNDTKSREFPRSPQIIGRKVELCHPPRSVDVVKAIIEAFRSGKHDQTSFWFDHHGRKIFVTYIAVRDKDKHYRGVLEISTDVSFFIDLEGEKRLLDWQGPSR